jgi:hypothetical protein
MRGWQVRVLYGPRVKKRLAKASAFLFGDCSKPTAWLAAGREKLFVMNDKFIWISSERSTGPVRFEIPNLLDF